MQRGMTVGPYSKTAGGLTAAVQDMVTRSCHKIGPRLVTGTTFHE